MGRDKIANKALSHIKLNEQTIVAIDRSTNIKRIFRLLLRKSLSPLLLGKMVLAEILRSGKTPSHEFKSICNTRELFNYIRELSPRKVVFFRAGLIINKKIISLGVPLFNIHCAKIPEFGGIGSIQKALESESYEQEASLHIITIKIDEGEVVDSEKFTLNPNLSYFANEEIAYKAGMTLLERTVLC